MAEFVDSTVKEIEGRLAALEDEAARLRAARNALLGGRRSADGARRTRATAPTRGRAQAGAAPARRGGNTRANQALELVRARPGITIPEIAKELGIEPNYLYRVMPKLVSAGQVTRQDKGWHPTS